MIYNYSLLSARVFRKNIFSLSLLVAAVCGVPVTQAGLPTPGNSVGAGVTNSYTTTNFTTWDASYSPTNTSSQAVEIYYPKSWGTNNPANFKVPGVLLFHGGGWTSGGKIQFRYICNYFAKRGLVAVTADYVYLTANQIATLPAGVSYKRVCITSASSAWHWFQQNAAQLGVDPTKIVIGGDSAGGHISLLCTMNRDLDWPGDPQGMTNPVLGYLMFNPAFSSDTDSEVNAFVHLTNNMAPSLFMEGQLDPWKSGADSLVSMLRSYPGNTSSEYVAYNVGHNYWVSSYGWGNCNLVACDNLLVRLGLLQGPSLVHTMPPYTFSRILSSP